MNAAKILLRYGLLFVLLKDAGGILCLTNSCSDEKACSFVKGKSTPNSKCRFMLVLNEDCSFIGAIAGPPKDTEEYFKNITKVSSKNLSTVGYSTTKHMASPWFIVSNDTGLSRKWTSDERSANSSCKYETIKLLCILLADQAEFVNKTMCPDPTTTTMVSTSTVVRTSVFLRGHRVALKITNSTRSPERTTSGAVEFTTSEDSDKGIPLWAYAVGITLFLLVIAGCVLGYFAWKRKWFQKKAKPAPPKKAEGKVILRPHNEFPDLMPDSVWKQMGPLRMLKNQKGPLVHKLDGVKSEPLKGPIQFDYANMEIYDIGEGVEILTGESSTLSLGPLPKSDTVHGGPPDVSVAGTTDVSVATQKSKKKDQLPVNITQKELKGDKKPEETHPNNPKKSNQLKVEQTQEE